MDRSIRAALLLAIVGAPLAGCDGFSARALFAPPPGPTPIAVGLLHSQTEIGRAHV